MLSAGVTFVQLAHLAEWKRVYVKSTFCLFVLVLVETVIVVKCAVKDLQFYNMKIF